MEELKKEKKKHNHKLTDLLKVSIFCTLMLAPFMAIASKCMYVVCNKNAKESYYGETINQEEIKYVNQNETLKINEKYYLDVNTFAYPTSNVSGNLYVNNFNLENPGGLTTTQIQNIANVESTIFRVYFTNYNNENTTQLYYYDANNESHWLLSTTTQFTISFNFFSDSVDTETYIKTHMYKITYNNYTYLDNVFYYATKQLEQENIFNWAKSTGIYTPINAMTSGMGITTNVIPMLLAYWSILTAIYIVFDLIIWIFTKLTHLINAE